MKIDVKDIKMGFWLGAGLALFGLLLGLLTRFGHAAISRGTDG